MNKPKKLIRDNMTKYLNETEYENILDRNALNSLYRMKVLEEVQEIFNSDHKDIMEFADLFQVICDYARANGFTLTEIQYAATQKVRNRGRFTNLALTNMNPNNPSNALYFNERNNKTEDK